MSLWRTALFLTLAFPAYAFGQTGVCKVNAPAFQGSYKGSCKDGLADGYGVATGNVTYSGNFVEGFANGHGVAIYANGNRYEGDWVKDHREGHGVLFFASGAILRGNFKGNRLDGVGDYTTPTGESHRVTENEDRKFIPYVDPATHSSEVGQHGDKESSAIHATNAPRMDLPYGGDLFPAFIIPMAGFKLQLVRGPNIIGNGNGSIRFSIHSEAPRAKVLIKLSIDEIADPTEFEATLAAPGNYHIYPAINYRYPALSRIQQPEKLNVVWSVSIDGVETLGNAQAVTVRPINDVPIAFQNSTGDQLDTRFLFAAFVNEDYPGIDALLAHALMTKKVESFTGYQLADPRQVQYQIEAIWTALQQRGFTYSDTYTNSDVSARVRSIHVRSVGQTMGYSQGTSVDGVVLLASILEKIGLHTELVLLPGHALLGVWSGLHREGVFYIETTLLNHSTISQAIDQGNAEFAKYSALPQRGKDKVLTVDVQKARSLGILPIASQ